VIFLSISPPQDNVTLGEKSLKIAHSTGYFSDYCLSTPYLSRKGYFDVCAVVRDNNFTDEALFQSFLAQELCLNYYQITKKYFHEEIGKFLIHLLFTNCRSKLLMPQD
jgi:hypothetical protein